MMSAKTTYASLLLLLQLTVLSPLARAQQAPPEQDIRQLESLTVEGVRPTDAGPMPGLMIRREQIPGNVQSVDKRVIQESNAVSVGDFMNSQMQSVTTNDYAGNPFQMDVNYRGFTASPQIGTPQGLSVFFDGIRVNEPFGDVVNWDLLPLNAIERFDVFPGSNPLFGLNTLGGAISLRSKNGFSAPGVAVELLGGSWGRKQLQLSAGKSIGDVAGFAALNIFDEEGWRDNSPTGVKQFFGRVDWQGSKGILTGSVLLAKNDLIGNGLVPIEQWRRDAESVFTAPDRNKNDLAQLSLSGAWDISDKFNLTGQVYRRKSDRSALNGDIYEGFEDLTEPQDIFDPIDFRGSRNPQTLPVCQYLDADANGVRDNDTPLNGPQGVGCADVSYQITTTTDRRNGRIRPGLSGPSQGAGIVDGTPIGLLTKSRLDQVSDGAALQGNWNLERHRFMLGASVDRSDAAYDMRQRLGVIDAAHNVFQDAGRVSPDFGAGASDITVNDFDGKSVTSSLYFSETWSPKSNLHLTLASRYNHSRIKTNLGVRNALSELHEVGSVPPFVLCPSNDPGSCPKEPQAHIPAAQAEQTKTSDDFTFTSLNPQLGVSWLPKPTLNLFANLSRGARVPSVVELGCAFDATPVVQTIGGTDFLQPRSFLGPTCNLPTTLSGDPFLPQIRSASGELGARGRWWRDWEWNASVFRTDLKNDIYFVAVGDGKSFFDTIDQTRRQGLEMGIKGRLGAFDISTNYSFVDATFQSRFYMLSPHNSSADFDQNSQSPADPSQFGVTSLPSPTATANRGFGTYRSIRVDPGARLPGIPAHALNLKIQWRASPAWKIGFTVMARSKSYLRGNENNLHQAAGTDQETGQYVCGANCLSEGLSQLPTSPGRAFTTKGEVPGFAVVNFDTSYTFRNGLRLTAQINNLFDKKYFTAGRLGINPFSPSTLGAIGPSGWNYNSSEWRNTTFVGPGAPRAFWVGLQYRWGADNKGASEEE